MLITSYHTEVWDLMNRATDPEGRPQCHVRHRHAGQVTVHRLVLHPNGWRHVGRYIGRFSARGYVTDPEKHGKKLSNSRIDLTLRSFAEAGHGNLYV